MRILITGGAGYIGSHLAVGLGKAGYDIAIIDNLMTGSEKNLLGGREVPFFYGDITSVYEVARVLRVFRPDVVIHLAGLKSVAGSIECPMATFEANLMGTLNLVNEMRYAGVKKLIFSSSATVYDPNSPYAVSKKLAEEVIHYSGRDAVILRYFNPIGLDTSGLLEEPNSENVVPALVKAMETGEEFLIYGGDYDTPDGTAVREYVDIRDLVDAHIVALGELGEGVKTYDVYGTKLSVRKLLGLAEKAWGVFLNARVVARRAGDVAELCYNGELLPNWEPKIPIKKSLTSVKKV